MVQTRRRPAAKRKSIKQSKSTKTPIKKEGNCAIGVGGKQRAAATATVKKLAQNLDRCKDWIQQQKREKLRIQLDDLDSNDSADDEARDINLATISDASENDAAITKVLYGCEWQRCNRLFETHPEFRHHVFEHVQAAAAAANAAPVAAPSTDIEFKCDWDLCDFECNDLVIFKRHVGYHVYMTKLKTVGEQLLLKRPMPACLIPSRSRNLIPNTDSRYVCMWQNCSYTFDMIEDYFEHTRSHCVHELEINKQGNRNKHVQCKWLSCKKMFNKRLKMTDHMRSHTGERFVACLNCGSTFNSYVKFYDHYRRQAINKSYKCYQCFQSFNTEELLNNHTYAHVNRIKCTECDMTCPSNAALTQHFRYRHLKERPYKCTECDYASVTKWDLNKHQLRMHSTEKATYICDECDFTCMNMNQMRNHARNEHGDGPNVYCCHCCDRQYKNGSTLSRHLIKVHGFRLPSGHRRFTYQMDINGVYRVQTTRMESLEVSKQIMATSASGTATNRNTTYALSEFKETADGIELAVLEVEQPEPVPAMTTTTIMANVEESTPPSPSLAQPPEAKPIVRVQIQDESHSNSFCGTINNSSMDHETNTFMQLLNLKSTNQHSDCHSHSQSKEPPKNIDNFSVIKKYAKKKRTQKSRVTYIIEEFDEQGNMIKTQTVPCDTDLDVSD